MTAKIINTKNFHKIKYVCMTLKITQGHFYAMDKLPDFIV